MNKVIVFPLESFHRHYSSTKHNNKKKEDTQNANSQSIITHSFQLLIIYLSNKGQQRGWGEVPENDFPFCLGFCLPLPSKHAQCAVQLPDKYLETDARGEVWSDSHLDLRLPKLFNTACQLWHTKCPLQASFIIYSTRPLSSNRIIGRCSPLIESIEK
ncbi:hypothetical protein CEXT_555111 [Caerostris extrusa]|uniref:Uncharacterized protein n=1 Tax=Caerostris extrusa TaxID=172846 RepID=A0AAV4Y151_CAEEX|nr:hypothetical protein CEXT_555111 [Caerostris extrusa]